MSNIDVAVYDQFSNNEIDNSTMVFITPTHSYEIGINNYDRSPLYVFTTEIVDHAPSDDGFLLYHESLNLSEIAERMFPGVSGVNLRRMRSANDEELYKAMIEVFKSLIISEVDEAMS